MKSNKSKKFEYKRLKPVHDDRFEKICKLLDKKIVKVKEIRHSESEAYAGTDMMGALINNKLIITIEDGKEVTI